MPEHAFRRHRQLGREFGGQQVDALLAESPLRERPQEEVALINPQRAHEVSERVDVCRVRRRLRGPDGDP